MIRRRDLVLFPFLCCGAVPLAFSASQPKVISFVEHVEAGGLMSYGADSHDWARQAAKLIDKIFKGANPADLPIEQPTKIDLVINRKTADALGLPIPRRCSCRRRE